MDLIKTCFVAFFSTLFCIWLLKPVAHHIGLVDRPGGRKWHENEIPLIGGIAIFFGFCFALLSLHSSLQLYRGLIAGSGLLVLMGVTDDFKELGAKLKLFGQFMAAVLLIGWGHELIGNIGNLFFFENIHLGIWAFPFTVFVVVGYINAMNMIDGQDGLFGLVALGQTTLLLLLSTYLGYDTSTTILVVMTVLLMVFLSFNLRTFWRKRASIFIGDAGSTFVAFVLAWFGVHLSQVNVHVIKPITILWILAFPLFDLVHVIIDRLLKGKSPFTAGKDHLHHILHMHGININLSTWILSLSSFVLGGFGILFNHFRVPEGIQFALLMSLLGLYIIFVRLTSSRFESQNDKNIETL